MDYIGIDSILADRTRKMRFERPRSAYGPTSMVGCHSHERPGRRKFFEILAPRISLNLYEDVPDAADGIAGWYHSDIGSSLLDDHNTSMPYLLL